MKKIISLITLISLLATLLTGCGKINVDKSVEALEAKGFTEYITYKSEADLFDATERINMEIEYLGGDFTVEIVGYTSLMQEWNALKNVQFITFSRKSEAAAYAELYLSKRDDYDNTKIAQKGKVVVITTTDAVESILELEFE